MDNVDKSTRSRMMSAVRQRNTKPEVVVRKLLHAAGFRFRLHSRDLPGTPDIVLPKYKVAIFVHGCFWHFHKNCRYSKIPSSNEAYWREKLVQNAIRDSSKAEELEMLGWRVLTVWQCSLRLDRSVLSMQISNWIKFSSETSNFEMAAGLT